MFTNELLSKVAVRIQKFLTVRIKIPSRKRREPQSHSSQLFTEVEVVSGGYLRQTLIPTGLQEPKKGGFEISLATGL